MGRYSNVVTLPGKDFKSSPGYQQLPEPLKQQQVEDIRVEWGFRRMTLVLMGREVGTLTILFEDA